MIAIIDYGMGNLRSVQKAFEFLEFDAQVTSDKQVLTDASHIVLPGVGAIADAVRRLNERGLDEEIKKQVQAGKPFLGICLGMQLLFDKSYENGEYNCLGLVEGVVCPFLPEDKSLKIPHMGWNRITAKECGLLSEGDGEYMYFVHSYHAADVPSENVVAVCEYGYEFVCGVQKGNIYGLQFHPEKSGGAGLAILKKFGGLS
ncbi:imidazole glycerol phosphate synthase subunit HisH [Christensenellaceae bacterium OttesenSCG-928-K19]|nr:imidazole glycerol phosphate synthase subunit HisH [Christensenellaceae bacterium OttesenSCG-928-K19]